MKSILGWLKSNPISVGALVIGCGSLVWFWMIRSDGREFVDQMSRRIKEIRRIESLERTVVKVPAARPDDDEQQLEIAVNQAAINQLERVYTRMNQEYREIFKLAVELNENGHTPMLEGLFPEPADASKPFEARIQYRSLIESMLGGGVSQPGRSGLKAAVPPVPSQVQAMLQDVETQFLAGLLSPKSSVNDLRSTEAQELKALKSQKIYEYFDRFARSVHLYAQTQITSPDFPLDVGDWSNPGLRPRMSQIWEGQLGLWIQQDIIEAIARANKTDDRKSDVIHAPVKRLIRVRVVPGYVGLPGAAGGEGNGGLSPSAVGLAKAAAVAVTQVPDDFSLSPTGRRSNTMYDVRHVELSVVLDSRMMLDFFDQLRQVNFMTVLKVDLADVDEYRALQDGYFYGSGDVVRADMLIETIWLRDWTVAYMHESVRSTLGVFE